MFFSLILPNEAIDKLFWCPGARRHGYRYLPLSSMTYVCIPSTVATARDESKLQQAIGCSNERTNEIPEIVRSIKCFAELQKRIRVLQQRIQARIQLQAALVHPELIIRNKCSFTNASVLATLEHPALENRPWFSGSPNEHIAPTHIQKLAASVRKRSCSYSAPVPALLKAYPSIIEQLTKSQRQRLTPQEWNN